MEEPTDLTRQNLPTLHRILHEHHRAMVAACIDHDLVGVQGGEHVFATCTKCHGRFKVKILADPYEFRSAPGYYETGLGSWPTP